LRSQDDTAVVMLDIGMPGPATTELDAVLRAAGRR
jgi:hypothetical protein